MTTTIKIFYHRIVQELASIYPANEAESIALILLNQFGVSRLQLITDANQRLDENKIDKITSWVERLIAHEPVQYVLGETEFYDMVFRVDENVLIPRPETEELVHWIIEDNKTSAVRILDIGTGSGCIPISLANNLPKAELSAIDVSKGALEMARYNAGANNVKVRFLEADILKWRESLQKDKTCGRCYEKDYKYDIVVSNPPYVRNLEKEQMSANVLEFEPSLALFVKNDDPLVFYRTIVEFCSEYLIYGGLLYFEINEAFGQETVKLMEQNGFENVVLKKDMQNKDRMIRGRKGR